MRNRTAIAVNAALAIHVQAVAATKPQIEQCIGCGYKFRSKSDIGWCYMFKDVPKEKCRQFVAGGAQ